MELELTNQELQALSAEILSLLRAKSPAAESGQWAKLPVGYESLSGNVTTEKMLRYEGEREYMANAGFLHAAGPGAEERKFLEMGEAARQPLSPGGVRLTDYSPIGYEMGWNREPKGSLEQLSERIRKDSRRYDGVLEKY